MVRKRSLSDADAGDIMLMDTNNTFDQQQQHSQSSPGQQQKRCCGTGRNPAPGELNADQVMSYLHSLSAHLTNGQLQYASTVLSAEGWQAFAELNILLGSSLSAGALPDRLLRSYSRFTLQPRAQLWQRYSEYISGKVTLTSQQLELLRFLLEWVLAPYPTCALTEVTLELPPSMVSWASRWHMASSSGRIRLIKLEAFPPMDPSSSTSGSKPQAPVRVLYVPALV